MKKTGVLSCCAGGASWFKQCGDSNDLKFEHTWGEGVQVCKDSRTGEVQKQALLFNQTNTVREQQTAEQETDTSNINRFYTSDSSNVHNYDAFNVMGNLLLTMMSIHIVIFS